MFDVRSLTRPIVVAPMAGGASTPELVAAAGAAGAVGFLAAGYRTVDQVAEQVACVRELGAADFGVNLFVPDDAPVDLAAAREYRTVLAPVAGHLGVELPEPRADDDAYDAKVAALEADPVPVVSFAFGCPSAEVVDRLHAAGTATLATVTSGAEARLALAVGVGGLVVQGPDAGGHRGCFDPLADPPARPLDELLDEVRAVAEETVQAGDGARVALVAAGGLGTPARVRAALARADAVQLGTAFLDADEAGTHAVHRAALRDPRYTETALTRAFSGRWARGLRNDFIERFGPVAPAAYPAVNQLTGPLRAAAARAGDAEALSLWAGTAWHDAPRGTAAQIIEALLD